ncbi:MAG: TonB-dependent receptor [Prolixibacteraceae bacterium]|nr:TonB-dependent receptor [Prolixibacteraceae bacterium]
MKLVVLLLFAGEITVFGTVYPQSAKQDAELKSISSKEMSGQGGVPFLTPEQQFSVQPKKDLSGIVTDKIGAPVPGVTVVVKGTTVGTITNEEGRFKLSVPADAQMLVFSFVGLKTQEFPIGNNLNFRVALEEETVGLEEVVAVGYGVQKKASVTAAISTVGTKDLVQSPQANISNMLVGRLPGLFAVQASGQPGQGQSILRIRGTGTFTGDTAPLILVDGIERPDYDDIDPNEIESLSILKDASATAVYGVRGANGVILITTRQGRKGARPEFSYSGNTAIQQPTRLPSFLGSYDYARLYNEAKKNDSYTNQSTYVPSFSEEDLELYRDHTDPIFHPDMNWMKEFFKPHSLQTQHNLNISGGAERARYFISAGYFDQEGMYRYTELNPEFSTNAKYKRYNFRSNLDFDITKRLSTNIKLAGQVENSNYPGVGARTIFWHLQRTNPLSTPGIIDNKVVTLQDQQSVLNPYRTLMQYGFFQEFRSNINSSVRINYELDFITKGLSVHGTIAYDSFYRQAITRAKELQDYLVAKDPNDPKKPVFIPQGVDRPLGFAEEMGKNRKIYAEAGIDYSNTFGVHTITGMVLYNQSKYYSPSLAFLVPNGYQGIVGRITYNLHDRYLAEFNMGYNGTENFAKGKRFGFFPAYSLSWIVSEEPLFPQNQVVTFLKIRGSYGEVGNDKISGTRFMYRPSAYAYNSYYNYYFGTVGQNYNSYKGSYEDKIGNPDLTWERAQKTNVGLEISFLKEKNITFIGDYFYEYRNNILANRGTIPVIVGANLPAYNLGRMENSGFEMELSVRGRYKNLFYWLKGNYTYAHNKVLFKDEAPKTYAYQNETGNRAGQFFGLIADGLYNTWEEINDPQRPVSMWDNNRLQPGDIRYVDVNKDGNINLDDRMPIGYTDFPEKTFGISGGLNFKGFDLSILFQGAANVSIQYAQYALWPFVLDVSSAKSVILERWTQERYEKGLPINFPRLGLNPVGNKHNYQSSTYWTRDADYVRLKNLEIGYTFSKGILRKLGLESVRVYVNGHNLYTWSDVTDFDPESLRDPDTGDLFNYPQQKVYNLGLNVKF